jgi:hypothetical protein
LFALSRFFPALTGIGLAPSFLPVSAFSSREFAKKTAWHRSGLILIRARLMLAVPAKTLYA